MKGKNGIASFTFLIDVVISKNFKNPIPFNKLVFPETLAPYKALTGDNVNFSFSTIINFSFKLSSLELKKVKISLSLNDKKFSKLN